MNADISTFNSAQPPDYKAICYHLAAEFSIGLPNAISKVWYRGPVWFLEGNLIAGYWVRKTGVQLLFWSGQSFDEAGLKPEGKF